MDELATIFAFFFGITFGPPLIFLIIALVKRARKRDSAKIFFILAFVWFIVGGGICASILS